MKIFSVLAGAIIASSQFCFAQGEFWGTTSSGGDHFLGTIFKISPDGTNQSVQHNFTTDIPGSFPVGRLVEAVNGKFYGLTTYGGVNGSGVLFEYDPVSGGYQKRIDFDNVIGSFPIVSMVRHPNGKLYGITISGGSNNAGSLFEFNPLNGDFVKKYDFHSDDPGWWNSAMTAGNDGKLYGLNRYGGANNMGYFFSFDPVNNIYSKIFDFDGINGSYPDSELIQSANGKLYGTTSYGGEENGGVLFEYDIYTYTYTKKIDFASGDYPSGTLAEENGIIYGTTSNTIFKYNPYTNDYGKAADIQLNYSSSGLIINSSNGKLYGIDGLAGSLNGKIFEYDPQNNSLAIDIILIDEFFPRGLIEGSDGAFYGLSPFGGGMEDGILFKFDPVSKTYTKEFDFNYAPDGAYPVGKLVLHSTGKFYGMAGAGVNGLGVMYEFDPASKLYSKKIDFAGVENGARPTGSLVEGNNGKLFGSTSNGGVNGLGTLFEYDPSSDSFAKKIDFDVNSGGVPLGDLIQAPNGKIYGFTSTGGAYNNGTLFEFDPATSTYIVKFNFDELTGRLPNKPIVLSQDGILYGSTWVGGSNGSGTLFGYDISNNVFTKLLDFTNNVNETLGTIVNSLIVLPNGKLYGSIAAGGPGGSGTLFEFDLVAKTYSTKIDCSSYNLSSPGQLLLLPTEDKIYGLTGLSGFINYSGAIFEYNPSTSDFSTIFNFSGSNGATPNSLVYNYTLSQTISFSALPSNKYGDAPFDLVATASSGLPVTFTSSDPTIATINGTTVTILKAGSVIINAHQSGDANTYPAPDVQQTLAINKATLTATADNQTKTYGEVNPNFTFSYSGFVGSDNASVLDTPPTILSTATQYSDAGTYSITLNGGTDNNYNLLLNNGTLAITQATLTATADNQTKRYGEVNPNFTFSYSGFVGTDNASVIDTPPTISSAVTQSTNVGSYPISLLGGADNNYSISLINGIMTVTKADQSIQFDAVPDKTIGDASFSLSAVASSALDVSYLSQSNKVSLSGNQVSILVAGRETIVASQTGSDNFNSAPTATQSFCIHPAKPTIGISNSSSATSLLSSSATAGNQWYFNGDVILGETHSTLIVKKPGDYVVQVTVDDCKSAFSDVTSPTITGDLNFKEKISLFPNPSNDYLFIKGLDQDTRICTIIDLVGGQLNLALSNEQELQKADVHSLSSGVYIFEVIDNGVLHILKFVKQ